MKKQPGTVYVLLFVCILLGAALACTLFRIRTIQSDLVFIPQNEHEEAYASSENFSSALRNGEIKSVLLLGDSISDNNGAWNHYFGQEERAGADCRLILTDEEEGPYYEDNPDSMGWSWYFRQYLLENTAVTTFHNNAIGGKSAKWFNARKEQAISQDYDAIVVMLGTNDRWSCESAEEFREEYGELLAYADSRCKYLQVFAPIPAFTEQRTDGPPLNIRQIAETAVQVCESNGYPCVNLYEALPAYAARNGMCLEEFYFGSTHPSPSGHYHLWRAIAGELGLDPSGDEVPKSFDILNAVSIGQNREDIDASTPLSAQADGKDIFPEGVSLYWMFRTTFIDGAPDIGVLTTYKFGPTSGVQVFRARDEDYRAVRCAQGNAWGEWQILDRG